MNSRRKDLGDVLSDASYDSIQAGAGQSVSLAAEVLVSPGQLLYMRIPAKELRDFADSLFPELAKNPIADCAQGWGHRYKAGHDLLIDVPSTFASYGPTEGIKHVGHILLTDFPTKHGIPIPGFSHSGIGSLLEQWSIPKAWLSLNICDAGFGFLAIADSHIALMAALQGGLPMDFGTAVQTFGAGTLELTLAMIATTNPVLMTAAGIQNILAGLVATWNTFSVYIDPLDFFGAAGVSTLLGFGMAHGLLGESISDALHGSIRSGTIGALYSVSTAFGYGALAGFTVCRLASELAKHHNSQTQGRLTVDSAAYKLLVETLCSKNADILELLAATAPRWLPTNKQPRLDKSRSLPVATKRLSTTAPTLDAHNFTVSNRVHILSDRAKMLREDAKGLSEIYRSALSSLTLQKDV